MKRGGKSSPAPRSRRSTKSQRAQTGFERELFVYDGQTLLDFIRVAGDGTTVVFDARGKKRGSFPSYEAARAALNKLAAPTHELVKAAHMGARTRDRD
jgi:hypothetical protein